MDVILHNNGFNNIPSFIYNNIYSYKKTVEISVKMMRILTYGDVFGDAVRWSMKSSTGNETSNLSDRCDYQKNIRKSLT